MKLVLDTNVLFSFFKKGSVTRNLVLNFEIFEPYTPSFCIEELNKHMELICKKSGLSEDEFKEVLEYMLLFIKVVPVSEYKEFLLDAKRVSPDPEDIDVFALALKLGSPIWSNDKLLKKQSEVEVLTTRELVEFLSRIKT